MNTTSRQHTRVPIPLTQAEDEQLAALCEQERRSRQSMAGIIYRIGLSTYQKQQTRQE